MSEGRPSRDNAKLFLAGRSVEVVWEDGTKGSYLCVFTNATVLVVRNNEGQEIIAPWWTVYRVIRTEPV